MLDMVLTVSEIVFENQVLNYAQCRMNIFVNWVDDMDLMWIMM